MELSRIAVFMDRDGTIIEDVPYLSDSEKVELLPRVGKAISKLNRRGVMAILVTNQSGITRGYYSVETVTAIHQRLGELLEKEGARLDSIYYCPHLPHEELESGAEGCDCRKPGMGMILQAQREHSIDLKRSFILGDKLTDVEIARKMGGVGILVKTGDGLNSLGKAGKDNRDFHICDDLSEAIDLALSLIPTG